MNHDLETITAMLVAPGKGILAADETVPTVTKRFDTLGIQSTEDSLRTYREYHRARCNGAASRGAYTDQMEAELVAAGSAGHRREWFDD
jgi:hypothetical protein